jgi:hypothetical protein
MNKEQQMTIVIDSNNQNNEKEINNRDEINEIHQKRIRK